MMSAIPLRTYSVVMTAVTIITIAAAMQAAPIAAARRRARAQSAHHPEMPETL